MLIKNANVAYNYQKNPSLVVNSKSQTQAELIAVLRNVSNVNDTRNIFNIFPVGGVTPVYGAGSPTFSALSQPQNITNVKYAGQQISGMGANI